MSFHIWCPHRLRDAVSLVQIHRRFGGTRCLDPKMEKRVLHQSWRISCRVNGVQSTRVLAYSENFSPISATRPLSQKDPPGSCLSYALSHDMVAQFWIMELWGAKRLWSILRYILRPEQTPWIKTSLICFLISLTSLCLRYPNTTSLWILHTPGLSDTRQAVC
jgi:hypothetical protein